MPEKVRIALDAMGGDHGPAVVGAGAELALTGHPDSEFILFGDRGKIEPLLTTYSRLRDACRIVHTNGAVRMDD
jgi:glycerol-3-phosphate acyltransferase PlsX